MKLPCSWLRITPDRDTRTSSSEVTNLNSQGSYRLKRGLARLLCGLTPSLRAGEPQGHARKWSHFAFFEQNVKKNLCEYFQIVY